MARKKKHEEHENHERWLVSYADFMTLLFAFFVVMYATSRVDHSKLVKATESIRFAMHFEGNGGVGKLPIFEGPAGAGGVGGTPIVDPKVGNGCVASLGPAPRSPPQTAAVAEILRDSLERRLRPVVLRANRGDTLQITAEPDRVGIRLAASDLFDPGQAALRPEVLPVLDAISAELLALPYPLRAEGHTDDTPVHGLRYRNNWELSASRAAAVVTYLEAAHRFSAGRLSAVGFGETRPLTPNDNPAARTQNRRIELVIELPPSASAGMPTR